MSENLGRQSFAAAGPFVRRDDHLFSGAEGAPLSPNRLGHSRCRGAGNRIRLVAIDKCKMLGQMLGLLTEIPRRFLCCAAAAAVARDSQVRQVVQQATQLARAVCNPRQPPVFLRPFALIRLRTGRAENCRVLLLRAEVIVTAGAERVAISCCRSP